ncbi:SulP family inorganic anion transporter, partial [Clostridium paraputrificum]
HGLDGLITAVIMAGVMLVIMGLLKFGTLIKYIPKTITVGFTAGIALTLVSTQLKDFLGLKIEDVPSEFIPKWESYFSNMNTIDMWSMAIGLLCIAIIVLWPKINKTIPGSMIALIVA